MHRHVDEWHASGRVQPGGPINYVYHGRIYELRATDTRPLAEIPLAASYQPRWWMQIELTLDDRASGPALAEGPNP